MPELLLQQQGLHQIIEQRHGKAGVKQGIGNPAPADQGIPRQQGRTLQPAAAENRLDDIAHTGDPEPDKGPEIGQHPPVLGQAEGQKGRNKADRDLEGIDAGGS